MSGKERSSLSFMARQHLANGNQYEKKSTESYVTEIFADIVERNKPKEIPQKRKTRKKRK
jgi:hypothetical protein